MGKTHRKEKTSNKTQQQIREHKNPLEKPVQSISMGSPRAGAHTKDSSKSHIKMGRIGGSAPEAQGVRPIEQITLDNVKSEAELKVAMETINKISKKIDNSEKTKKVKTWSSADPDYELPIDRTKQNAVIKDAPELENTEENAEMGETLGAANRKEWPDFPLKDLPVLKDPQPKGAAVHKSMQNMSIRGNSQKKVSFKTDDSKEVKQGKETEKLMGYSEAKAKHPGTHGLMTTPAHLRHDRKQFGATKASESQPLKKTVFSHANNIKPVDDKTIEGLKKEDPSYNTEDVLGYSKVDPGTHKRATYYSILQSPLKNELGKMTKTQKRSAAAKNAAPADHASIEKANRTRTELLAEKTTLVNSGNGSLRVQRTQRQYVVDDVFKSRHPAKNDPFLKRVQHRMHNKTAKNEYAKESKFSSTYKQPKLEDLE